MRLLVRKPPAPSSAPQPLSSTNPELVPPPGLMQMEGVSNLEEWFRWSVEWSTFLRIYAGLTTTSRVLEIGCGLGRIAFSLRDILFLGGNYNGFDISREKISFLGKFREFYPNFEFEYADIKNTFYNPSGLIDAASYRFPYPDRLFDIVYAASVFTHMLPEAASNYIREASRVLRPGGRCLFSFFLLDYYRPGQARPLGWARSFFNFDHQYGGFGAEFAAANPRNLEDMTAYTSRFVQRVAAEAGLELARPPLPGFWSGNSSEWVGQQDMLVLRKGNAA